jgi:DNA primase
MNAKEYLEDKRIDLATQELFGLSITNSGQLSIPIVSSDGKLLFHKYRNFTGNAKYVYEKGTTAQLFGIDKIKEEHKWVLVVEGEMEAVVLGACGVPAVSSTGGCGTFREDWVDYLKGKQAVVIYDNDEAGRKGEEKVYHLLSRKGIKCSVRHLSGDHERYKDFGEIMAQEGKQGVKMALKTSVSIEIKAEEVSKVTVVYKEVVSRIKGKDKDFMEMMHWAKQYDTNRLLAEYGHTPISKNGRDYTYHCIFHHEKTGSMTVYADGHTYCYGCHKLGDSVEVYKELGKVSFRDAVYNLVDKL